MLGNCREADLERLCDVRDGGFAMGKASENGAAGGIGEGGESRVERIGGHFYLTVWLNTAKGVGCQGRDRFSAGSLISGFIYYAQ